MLPRSTRVETLVNPGSNPGKQGIVGMSRYTEGYPGTRVWTRTRP